MSRENDIAAVIVDAAYRVHSALGPGLMETVYEVALEHDLKKRGCHVKRQEPVRVEYDGIKFEEGFRADLIVNDCVIVELKSIETLAPVHMKQLLTYLRLTGMKLGLLINFGAPLIKDGIVRVVNGLEE
jgi:GxxExxY protein